MAALKVIEHWSELPFPDGDDSIHAPAHATRELQAAVAVPQLTPTEKAKARGVSANYMLRMEKQRDLHDYTQARPYKGLGKAPEVRFNNDCSAYAACEGYWTQHVTGFLIPDPLGMGYSGWGFTGTALAANRQHPVPLDHVFMVGDMAIYGQSESATHHMTVCRVKGLAEKAVFSSNGSQAGPLPTRVSYRGDLLGVFRPAVYL